MPMTVCPFITELSVLISEVQTLVALSEPGQVLPLAQRVLGKTGRFDISMAITEEEGILLETHGVNLWNCATTHLLEAPLATDSMNETRATLYHIGYRMLSEAYKNIMENDINVSLQLLEMATFTGSQYTACQKFTHAKELLESANQCIQNITRQTTKKEQQQFSNSQEFNQCQTDLMMAFVELAARQGQWKEVQVYIQKIDGTMAMQPETPKQNVDLLSYLCCKVASDFVDKKEWDHTLRWTISFCSSVKDYAKMEEYLLTRLAQLIYTALEGQNNNILDVGHTHRLLDIIDGCFKNSRTGFEFHCLKLMVLLAGDPSFSPLLERALFDMMENLDIITEESYQMTQRLGSLQIHLAEKLSLNLLVNGLNLYIQRCLAGHDSQESDTYFQQLYLFKFYIFSEWISRKSDLVDQSPQYMDTIKKIMEEMYLVKNRLTNEDLWSCQMILWSVGDIFFKNENHLCALPWYKQIWSFGITSLKEDTDLLVLARKLTTCCIHLGDWRSGATYMETSIAESGVTATALDYLLLLETSTSLKDTTKAGQYLDLLLHAQGFTDEILMSAAYTCHKNENGELMQKILDHAFDISDEYMDQEPFKWRLMTLLRWTIRLCVYTKPGSDINSVGLLVNKDAIVKYMGKAAGYYASLIGPISKELENDKEWVLRTGWNLGLQFYGRDHEAEGTILFAATTKIICLDLDQGILNNQYLSCLFACMASRLYSPFFQQMNESDRISICNEINSVVKKVSDMKPGIDDHDAFVSIIVLIQVQCYATLNMFENCLEAFKGFSNRLGQTVDLKTLDVFERLAGIILQHETCPQTVATQILKMASSALERQCSLGNEIVDKWAKWNRLYISLAMLDHQNKNDMFHYIGQLCVMLSTADSAPYPQKEIHYLVIITWNEGVIRCHNSDAIQGERWCRLAHDLLSHLDSSHNALKYQINRAFRHFEKSTET